MTITATVAYQFPAQALQQTETVTFYDGATPLGTAPVVLGLSQPPLSRPHCLGGRIRSPRNIAETSTICPRRARLESSDHECDRNADDYAHVVCRSCIGVGAGDVHRKPDFRGRNAHGLNHLLRWNNAVRIRIGHFGRRELQHLNLGAGAHTITATYGGDSNFGWVTGSALTQTIEAFTLERPGGGNIPSQTASPGGQATYMLAVGPPSGASFPATVTFSVTGCRRARRQASHLRRCRKTRAPQM